MDDTLSRSCRDDEGNLLLGGNDDDAGDSGATK